VRRVTFGSADAGTLGLVAAHPREWKEKGTYGTLEAYGFRSSNCRALRLMQLDETSECRTCRRLLNPFSQK